MILQKSLRTMAALTALVFICFCEETTLKPKKPKLAKYSHKIRDKVQNEIWKKTPRTDEGVWSTWSPWSPCSRTCGGGVTIQTRHCIPPSTSRFVKRQRRRRQYLNSNGCVGLYKRVHLCNNQECPVKRDFRLEQCSNFNRRPYKGKIYKWVPFTEEDECSLNCRPLGMDFYATLNRTVINGTPCKKPAVSTGRAAPLGTKGICIDGLCKAVSSHGVIGSIDEEPEQCSSCTQGNCRSINGIYTRANLPLGYSLVAQIPKGACRILIEQMQSTKNLLALKNSNGSFFLNGDWKFNNGGFIKGAGATFAYVKQDGTFLETITSAGPLANPVDLFIVIQQVNQGIKYGYLLPNKVEISPQIIPTIKRTFDDTNLLEPKTLESRSNTNYDNLQDEARTGHLHRTRRVRRRYSWKISGISACSKTCGGGIQTTVVTCVRELNQAQVQDKRCSHLDRPKSNPIRCNIQDCTPEWEGTWSPCSTTCGTGTQQFAVQCKQELNTGRTIVVNDVLCSGRPRPLLKTQTCIGVPCNDDNELIREPQVRNGQQDWVVGPWSPCSPACGRGHRSRSVTCPSGNCNSVDRPKHFVYCDNPPCSFEPQNQIKQVHKNEKLPWLVTDWSQCSENCGTGTQTRYAICGKETCDISTKPEATRGCSSDRQCGGYWVVGPWKDCPETCSTSSRQKRDVFCIVKIRGVPHITKDMTCPIDLKPIEEQPCNGKCTSHWYMGEWGECEGCPHGVQRREVKCMDIHGLRSELCGHNDAPIAKRECQCETTRSERENKYKPVQDQPINRSCSDNMPNCYLAVQARLCQYPYYQNHCCHSCGNFRPE